MKHPFFVILFRFAHIFNKTCIGRRMKIWHIQILAVLALLLFGCSNEQPKVEQPKVGVLLSVAGRDLTVSNLDAKVEMMGLVRNLSSKPVSKKELKRWKASLRESYPQVFITQAVLADYARAKGIQINKATLNYYQKKAVRQLHSPKIKKYSQLLKKVGSLAPMLDERITEEALVNEVRKFISNENPTNFPSEFVKLRCQQQKDYNARMTLTNAVIYARATNVWEQLKGGADFVEMVRKHTEIEAEIDEKGELGVLSLQQVQGEPMFEKALRELKVGEISGPIEGDNGLMIIRMDSKDVAKDEYGISRIYFRLPMFVKALSEKEMEKQLRKEHNERVVSETIAELVQSAKVEYFNEKTGEKK